METLKRIDAIRTANHRPVFLEPDEMPVTSSPIEGKLIENPSFNNRLTDDLPTWGTLLGDYCHNAKNKDSMTKGNKARIDLECDSLSCKSSVSSSLQPIAEHKVRLLVTPNRKIKIISSSSQGEHYSTKRPSSPMKCYSKLSRAYRLRFEESSSDDKEENVQQIKQKLLKNSRENVTLQDVERYERILRKYIDREIKSKEERDTEVIMSSDVMKVLEKDLGKLDLTPTSIRILKMKQQQQEKRLVSLAVSKRKSAAEIKKRLSEQQANAQKQISIRESQEMKQIKASQLKKEAITMSTLFNKAHAAHYKHVVDQMRQSNHATELSAQIQREKLQNYSQASKIVQDVWNVLLRQQYGEMREEVKKQKKMQYQEVQQSTDQLQRFKQNYEEQLKELKKTAQAEAALSGLRKREIICEIDRIQLNLRQHFDAEFKHLIQKIHHKEEHKRFIREEKAERLRQRIQRADYVFDI